VRKGARELFSEFWRYTRGDRLRLLGGGLLSVVLVGAELGTVVIFEAIDVFPARASRANVM
jgi:hypothetical protein